MKRALWGTALRRSVIIGVSSTLLMIILTLVAASTNGLTARAVVVVVVLWTVTGGAATAAAHQQHIQRVSASERRGRDQLDLGRGLVVSSPAAQRPLEQCFLVGARVARWNGGGHLVVAPGSLVLIVGRLLRSVSSIEQVSHTGDMVTLTYTRLVPPWMNTSLVLCDGEYGARITVGGWIRHRLRAALEAAGFTVAVRHTWFSLGPRVS